MRAGAALGAESGAAPYELGAGVDTIREPRCHCAFTHLTPARPLGLVRPEHPPSASGSLSVRRRRVASALRLRADGDRLPAEAAGAAGGAAGVRAGRQDGARAKGKHCCPRVREGTGTPQGHAVEEGCCWSWLSSPCSRGRRSFTGLRLRNAAACCCCCSH